MNIKKFIGKNMNEIMAQIKLELGDDAMIIQSKKIKKGGLFGFFGKEYIEVMAAVERDKQKEEKPKKEKDLERQKNIGDEINSSSKNFMQEVSRYSKNIENYGKKDNTNVSEELQEIKKVIHQLNKRFTKTFQNEEDEKLESRRFNAIIQLKKMGISEELSIELVNSALEKNNEITSETLISVIHEKVGKICGEGYNSTISPYCLISKYNIFVGPTGVGKTTTLAKLASNFVIKDNKRIGFLTLDTYRISAVEQLKTYAEILNVPIEVAYDKEDVNSAVHRLENREILFIDTAGRSHKNQSHMEELKDTIEPLNNMNVFLTIPANYNIEDIKSIINSYYFINNFNIIVTKLDETDRLGIILDIILFSGKIPSFITYGQNVPNDIEDFNFNKFVNELFMGSHYDRV